MKNILFLFFSIILGGYFYYSWNYLTISNDALYQLTVLNNLFHGFGPMDNLIINKGYVADLELLKWWSPLCYLVPFVISKILFVSYSKAITICLTISICLTVWILKKIGSLYNLSENSAAVLVLCFVLQRAININFLQYTGGDLFILPIGLYQFYLTYKIVNESEKVQGLLYFLVLSIIGILFKLNYVIYVFAFLGVLLAVYYKRKEFKKIPGLIIIFSLVSFTVYFFTSGSGTANETAIIKFNFLNITQSLIIPLIGVVFSFFSIQSILANIPNKSSTYFDIINSWTIEGVWLGLFILTSTLIIFWRNFRNSKMIILFTGIVVLLYSFFYIKGAYVGHEDRYFILSSVLVIFYLYSVAKDKIQRIVIHTLLTISSLYGIWNFVYRYQKYNSQSNSIETKNFGLVRIPNSPAQNKEFKIIGEYIEKNFPKYCIYTSNESYFYFQSSKNPLIHDWNFQIMGFQQFEIEKINQIRFSPKMRTKGIVFVTTSFLKNKEPDLKIGECYLYTIKNNNYE
jgi:hypothetical protein